MDIIYIRDLKIDAVIGVHDWERARPQSLYLSLEMGTDIRAAAAEDALSLTLDYHAIAHRLIDEVSRSECQLIETLAEHVARLLMAEYDLRWLRLTLSKPGAVPEARDVGVIIERGSAS